MLLLPSKNLTSFSIFMCHMHWIRHHTFTSLRNNWIRFVICQRLSGIDLREISILLCCLTWIWLQRCVELSVERVNCVIRGGKNFWFRMFIGLCYLWDEALFNKELVENYPSDALSSSRFFDLNFLHFLIALWLLIRVRMLHSSLPIIYLIFYSLAPI